MTARNVAAMAVMGVAFVVGNKFNTGALATAPAGRIFIFTSFFSKALIFWLLPYLFKSV